MAVAKTKKPTGVDAVHARGCPSGASPKDRSPDARCNCTPTYSAWAYDPHARTKDGPNGRPGKLGTKVRRNFTTQAAAKSWRRDRMTEIAKGRRSTVTTSTPTLRDAAEAWLEGAKSGAIRTRSGDIYK